MWDALKQSDIAQARQELEQRRAEILRRHEEELKDLNNEQGEIEKLERLLEAFAQKFKGASAGSFPTAAPAGAMSDSDHGEPVAADSETKDGHGDDDEPAVAEDGSVVETRRSRGGDSSSNFDVFSRAISKTL